MHGLVIDYDAIVADKDIALLPFNGVDGLLPMWSTMTYSGKRRLIWEFEQPVLCDHEELTQRFLKQLAKTGKFKNLLPALDENSYKLTQYFELGREWKRIPEGRPVSSNTLGTAFFKAAEQKSIPGKRNIPMEAVAAEVERRWPGRITGEFAEGLRTPLFWIDDGIDRIGASVGEFGMLCYSDRAESQFMSWGKILGNDFIRKYEEEKIGSVTNEWWYVGKEKCYVQEHGGKLSLPYNYTQVQRRFPQRFAYLVLVRPKCTLA